VQKETGMKNNNTDKQQKAVKRVKAVKAFGEEKLLAMAAVGREGSGRITIGLDLGDRSSSWCALRADGEVMARGEVITDRQPLELFFGRIPRVWWRWKWDRIRRGSAGW
jgi:hypothetical protein